MKLKDKEMDKLLDKYLSGESSEQEELLLKSIADQNDEFRYSSLKKQFDIYENLKEDADLGIDFDENILNQIRSSGKTNSLKRNFYAISAMAASIAALFLIWFGASLFSTTETYATVSDPQIAFNETKVLLEEVSDKLNKGIKPAKKTVNKVDSNIKRTNEIYKMKDALEKTKNLDKFEKASEFLKSINKVYIDLGNS